MTTDDSISLDLVRALSAIWTRIRDRHQNVPPVVLLPAPAERGRGNVLGHFAPVRWQPKNRQGSAMHEVVVVGEHLDRKAEAIAETLIHEAAHALNFARGIKDCSRSQYHNQNFKSAAEELGLIVKQVANYGFAHTTLPVDTARLYEAEIRALDEVLVHRRKPPSMVVKVGGDGDDKEDDTNNGPEEPKGRLRKATCACPFIIRVSKKTMADTTIRCESCGKLFEIV